MELSYSIVITRHTLAKLIKKFSFVLEGHSNMDVVHTTEIHTVYVLRRERQMVLVHCHCPIQMVLQGHS